MRPDTRRRDVLRRGGVFSGVLVRFAFAGALAAALAACTPVPPRPDALRDRSPVELTNTPFFPQEVDECGPAALATVLGAAGHPIEPQALAPRLLVPDRHGTFQPEMLAQARREGFIALTLDPSLAALVAELDAGRPVLTLQNNGLSWYPRWHYAVAIGYDPAADAVMLRSGVTERMVLPRRTFENTWARSGRWAFVLLRPGQLPAGGDGLAYARAVAAFESTAAASPSGATVGAAEARRAWTAGRARWPASWELAFGAGNRRYADGALDEATAAFEDATRLDRSRAAGWNNLAVAYMDAGRWNDAVAAAERAAGLDPSPEVLATRSEARCRRLPGCR